MTNGSRGRALIMTERTYFPLRKLCTARTKQKRTSAVQNSAIPVNSPHTCKLSVEPGASNIITLIATMTLITAVEHTRSTASRNATTIVKALAFMHS